MRLNELKENIIDIIKEEQVKLGYRKETIRLYYPLASLNTLLGTQLDHKNMLDCLYSYFGENKDIFGDVDVSYKGDRFCLCLSDKASEYVHNNTEQSGFLYDFINTIGKHDVTIEELLDQFKHYSDDIHFEKMENEDFDYLIYFENGIPDSYRYCINEEGHHLIYHRYTKLDYYRL